MVYEDSMEEDFEAFTYVIQPSMQGDTIHLILVCCHNITQKNTNALIDPDRLIGEGNGYIFGLMQTLTHILKTKLGL